MSLELRCHNGNAIRLFGLTNAERVRRMAEKRAAAAGQGEAGRIEVDLDYAFDPAWFDHIAAKAGRVLTDGGKPVLARYGPAGEAPENAEHYELEDRPSLYNDALRKTQHPFCMKVTGVNRPLIERESYYGAYKGVTDILTKYLWPRLAFHLTRAAAALRLSPNMVTAAGAVLCVLAAWLFAQGEYWWGSAAGFGFMVLDTVDGKLARCTMTSSGWGNVFDHGIDLVHPPFWYWFWATGLIHWGLGYDSATFWAVQGVLWGGYVAQRLIEGWFIHRFAIHIHVWRRFDSRFRLVTARRNPNMILLVGSLLFGRPDIGLICVAVWTGLSLLVHLVQTVEAELASAKGRPITSWLTDQ